MAMGTGSWCISVCQILHTPSYREQISGENGRMGDKGCVRKVCQCVWLCMGFCVHVCDCVYMCMLLCVCVWVDVKIYGAHSISPSPPPSAPPPTYRGPCVPVNTRTMLTKPLGYIFRLVKQAKSPWRGIPSIKCTQIKQASAAAYGCSGSMARWRGSGAILHSDHCLRKWCQAGVVFQGFAGVIKCTQWHVWTEFVSAKDIRILPI